MGGEEVGRKEGEEEEDAEEEEEKVKEEGGGGGGGGDVRRVDTTGQIDEQIKNSRDEMR